MVLHIFYSGFEVCVLQGRRGWWVPPSWQQPSVSHFWNLASELLCGDGSVVCWCASVCVQGLFARESFDLLIISSRSLSCCIGLTHTHAHTHTRHNNGWLLFKPKAKCLVYVKLEAYIENDEIGNLNGNVFNIGNIRPKWNNQEGVNLSQRSLFPWLP